MIRKILILVVLAVAALAGVLLFNTLRFTSRQAFNEAQPAPELPAEAVAHFRQAVTYRTISNDNPALFDSAQFTGFRRFLETTYPNVHSKLSREIVADYSLLYKWEGRDQGLGPIILMAHQDVVPIEDATKTMWTVDPFGGELKEDFIWGRGTTDDKLNLVSIFEAVEKLLKENYQPERTVYLVFGHDEELGGSGAKAVAAVLKSRNVKAELVLDEGGIITKEKVPDMTRPVALLGTAEKGFLSLELTVEKAGGHSSMPEEETAVDILSKALVNLRANPLPAEFTEATEGLFDHIGPEMTFSKRLFLANRWLFKRGIISAYAKGGGTNAMVRTTMVPTIINAGMKENVIPTVAKAVVNFRLLPGNSAEDVIAHVTAAINDERVKISSYGKAGSEATPVTSTQSFAYRKVEMSVRKTFAQTITTPFLLIGGTDSRHFGEVSSGIIKFSPMVDPIGFHGIDERVSLESYRYGIWFFEQLIRDSK